MTINLFALHGTGDAYMTLGFAKAVERVHGYPVRVFIKPEHEAIARMFPTVDYGLDTRISNIEADTRLQQNYENNISDGCDFYAHPSFMRSGVRIDELARLPGPLTHADLWRAMLKLPPATEMQRGRCNHRITRMPKQVFILREARSWPNSKPEFWSKLIIRLSDEGWTVRVNDVGSLFEVLEACSEAEWVIGPQCGIMAILCHAQFPCRKTIATPSVDGTGWIVDRTYPYALVTKFAGEDYDISEVKITDEIDLAIVQVLIENGGTGKPVGGVAVNMTYGDFFDRLSILHVKMMEFGFDKMAKVSREAHHYADLAEPILKRIGPPLLSAYRDLIDVNLQAFRFNESAVPDALACKSVHDDHANAIRLNRKRVALKNIINSICGSAHVEVKSYYEGDGTK